MKITLFGTQPYDKESFERIRDAYGFDICYHRSHLNANNVALAKGSDAVCIFVNDTADAETIRQLADLGVKLIALRCAGFNNVDLNAAARCGIPVVRVPAYSPHAVAEHAVALMLALNRKVHRAYWRTRDGNFSLHGLLGFDMYGKTAGIVGTGKIARELIRILKGFGMEIVANDLYPDRKYAAEAGIAYVCKKHIFFSFLRSRFNQTYILSFIICDKTVSDYKTCCLHHLTTDFLKSSCSKMCHIYNICS